MDIVMGTVMDILARQSCAIMIPFLQQLIREIDDVILLDENRLLLQDDQLYRMKKLLFYIIHKCEDAELPSQMPPEINNCLQRMQHEFGRARELIYRSQRARQYIQCVVCKPRLSTQTREWKTSFDELFQQLETHFSMVCNAHQVELYSTLVGSGIKSAMTKLNKWLTEATQVQVIHVYGDKGIGKTALLKRVYNTYKVSNVFDVVIWVECSEIESYDLASYVAQTIKLQLPSSPNVDYYEDMFFLKDILSAYLKGMKFLLILDNLSCPFHQLGVAYGNYKGSKIIFSGNFPDREITCSATGQEEEMEPKSMEIQPLSTDESWEMFSKVAFQGLPIPQEREHTAREIVLNCKGLPLTIKVIATTMIGNTDVSDWNIVLCQMIEMQNSWVPLKFPENCSYNTLPDGNMQSCFLYCIGLFPRHLMINVRMLVANWIAEGLVHNKETADGYIKFLVKRCFFEKPIILTIEDREEHFLQVHTLLRQTEKETAGMENFLAVGNIFSYHDHHCEDWKRIAFYKDISELGLGIFRCPNLVTMIFRNKKLENVPETFFLNFTSVRVLDLSQTLIKSLPASVWQLTQLRFLNLSYTKIEEVGEEIGNLSCLQFLYLVSCTVLKSLPRQIGELTSLMCLDLWNSHNLQEIPVEITTLPNCNIIRN